MHSTERVDHSSHFTDGETKVREEEELANWWGAGTAENLFGCPKGVPLPPSVRQLLWPEGHLVPGQPWEPHMQARVQTRPGPGPGPRLPPQAPLPEPVLQRVRRGGDMGQSSALTF